MQTLFKTKLLANSLTNEAEDIKDDFKNFKEEFFEKFCLEWASALSNFQNN